MSSDAKVWQTDNGSWEGLHDGDCNDYPLEHVGTAHELVDVMNGIEGCMKVVGLRWELRAYPDNKLGLVGYIS